MFQPMIFFIAFTAQDKTTPSYHRMPVYGTLYESKLYGLFQTKEPRAFRLSAINLKKAGHDAQHMYGTLTTIPGVYQRYRIRYNRVWMHDASARIKSMSFEELALFDYRAKTDGWDAYLEKYKKCKGEPGMISVPALIEKPYRDAPFSSGIEGLTGLAIVPTSENTVKTFLFLTGKKEIEIWDTEARFNAKTMTWENVADEKNFERIEPLFSEDFYVFLRKDTYYFITQSGKLYFAPPPRKDEGSRTMQELWWDAKRPIVAIVEDADHDKIWLFAKDKNRDAKYDLYFELKDTIRCELYDPTKLRPVNIEGRARPLLELLPLVRPDVKKK